MRQKVDVLTEFDHDQGNLIDRKRMTFMLEMFFFLCPIFENFD